MTASKLTFSIAGPVQVPAGALTVNTPPPVSHGRRTGVWELWHGILINLVLPTPCRHHYYFSSDRLCFLYRTCRCSGIPADAVFGATYDALPRHLFCVIWDLRHHKRRQVWHARCVLNDLPSTSRSWVWVCGRQSWSIIHVPRSPLANAFWDLVVSSWAASFVRRSWVYS